MLRYLQALILDKIKGVKILCITVIAGLKAINSAMVKVQLTDLQSKSYHDNELQLLQGIFLIFKLLCHTNSTIFFFFQNKDEFKQQRGENTIKKRNNAEIFHSVSGGECIFPCSYGKSTHKNLPFSDLFMLHFSSFSKQKEVWSIL